MRLKMLLAAPLACIAAVSAVPAAAQLPAGVDLSEDEMATLARLAMPTAFRSLQTKCNTVLDADAYMYRSGDALHRRLTQTSEAAWPAAGRMIARVAARGNPAMGEVLAGMPADSLRPFVNEMVAGMVTTRVEADQCERIDRVLALLEPLPPENLADLAAYAYVQAREADAATPYGAAR
ncbi:hypothetical protein M3P36_08580 [Altererythrobacter sp. KTW20L]|uniref:hypothetical protein n=1 Tax=Altererythrobacter sp. KTW20L TaxID=2942210 RepID=UPI0020BFC5B6|nr:hypothetical protein [Altererythrobacter sp. KTW20L]MCL6251096.1 hypothetical protein [Altererythrobacter sp. KTW20L]